MTGQPPYPGTPHGQPTTQYPPPGYPPHPVAPSGYPSYPAAQPGYPPQQQAPAGAPAYPPMPPRGGPRRRGRTVLFGCLGLALLLVVGVGTTLVVARVLGGSDDVEVAWALSFQGKADKTADGDQRDVLYGSWMTDAAIVRAQSDGVIAYKLTDGAKLWATPVPEGMSMCNTSWLADRGKVAVVFGPADRCDRLAAVDLADGRLAWQATIPAVARRDERDERPAPVVTAAGGAAVVRTRNFEVLAFDLAGGRRLWTRTPPDKHCLVEGMEAGPQHVVIGEYCDVDAVVGLDLASGKQLWRTPVKEQEQADWVLSVSPTVLVRDGLPDDTQLTALSDDGRVTARIPKVIDGAPVEETTSVGYAYLTDRDTVYLKLRHKGSTYQPGQIAAYDVHTGERRWMSSGHEGDPCPVQVDDKGLLVLETVVVGEARLIRIDRQTGQSTLVAELPEAVGDTRNSVVVHESDGVVAILARKRAFDNRSITVVRL